MKTVAAGKYRQRASLESSTDTTDEYGHRHKTWSAGIPVWCKIEPIGGKEVWQAQQAQSNVTHRITMRYRGDVRATWRLRYRGRLLNFETVRDVEERRIELEIAAVEGADET